MSAKILTIAQQKGGAGKTTLAAHLAVAWQQAGRRVALVDIDPQESLTAWVQRRAETETGPLPTLGTVSGWRVTGEVERLAGDHDLVLVDIPPHADNDAGKAVRVSDLVLVPVQPSPMDLWASEATVALAARAGRPVLLVLNRVPPRGRLTEQVAAALAEAGHPVAEARIGNRVALAASLAEGRGVTEAAPRGSAAAEIRALAAEIEGRLG